MEALSESGLRKGMPFPQLLHLIVPGNGALDDLGEEGHEESVFAEIFLAGDLSLKYIGQIADDLERVEGNTQRDEDPAGLPVGEHPENRRAFSRGRQSQKEIPFLDDQQRNQHQSDAQPKGQKLFLPGGRLRPELSQQNAAAVACKDGPGQMRKSCRNSIK